MQPTISIPPNWKYPRFTVGQRTEQGIIIGIKYYPPDSLLAHEYGEGWRYIVMPDRYFEDEENYPEDKLQPLTPQELKTQIQTEIEQLSHQIQLLTSELENIARKHFCDVKNSHLIRKFKHE
jgi:hypothetical protein